MNGPQEESGRPDGEKRHIVKAAATMGSMTLLSRILGMVRDIVSANAFGTTWQWDAFLYAFMIPNFLRRIVGEGAFSSAFIPVYNEVLHRDGKEAAFRFASTCMSVLMTFLALFIVAMELVLTGLLQIQGLSPTLRLTLDLLRFLFPYLWFVSLWALTMGVLNSHRHFFSSALGPVILNLAWIGGILYLLPRTQGGINAQLTLLAIVISIEGLIQLAIELPPLYRLGFRVRWIWDTASPALAKVGRLIMPSLLSFAIFQVNVLVDMTLGLIIGPGANSSLWYGTRLMQLPLGVFAVAAGSALLTSAARQSASANLEETKSLMSFALRGIFLIVLPCAVGLIVLAAPIVQMLFEHGQFDAESTRRTAAVLTCYCVGLFAYSGQKIINNGFYAAQDTRTPMRIGAAALAMNMLFNLIFMGPLKEAGLALATSLSGIFQFGLLAWFYYRRIASFDVKGTLFSFFRICGASLAMGALCYFVYEAAAIRWPGDEPARRIFRVLLAIGVSAASYPLWCVLFRVREMGALARRALMGLARRGGRSV